MYNVHLLPSATDVLLLNRRSSMHSLSSAYAMLSALSSIAVLSRWPRVSAAGVAASNKVKMKQCPSVWTHWWWWWWRVRLDR